MKALFTPLSLGVGLVAGALARRLFNALWGMFEDYEPPKPEHRRVGLGKLAVALAIEGAIFRVVKGFVDRGLRTGFSSLSGEWPGDEAPEPH